MGNTAQLNVAEPPLVAAEHAATGEACFHCGEPCTNSIRGEDQKRFCCNGCLIVHDLLTSNGLGHFYDLDQHPGVRVGQPSRKERWTCLDEPEVSRQLLDFSDEKISRVRFRIPAIHCIACVWLLENLFQLHSAIGRCQVIFPKREATITFATGKIKLSELVALMASIGYEPQLTLGELVKEGRDPGRKRQWLQVGLAGFAFGNIMLFSLPAYLGLDSFSAPLFHNLFGFLSLALAAPVLAFSASDYWQSALLSFRQRVLTLDVPIALGLAALYLQSAFEIIFHRGAGYLDSLVGLIFFLLCGRLFQQKTHERLAFDRDYKCFFPLSAMRKTAGGEESVAISQLRVGDHLLVRNAELIPADSRLIHGPGLIDYSFVTGESEPVTRKPEDYLYAGGQQVGGTIEVELLKPVSQSYLTSLWTHEAFQKKRDENLNTLTNRYSRRFTRLVLTVAVGAAMFWIFSNDRPRAIKAFASVLIVACPCALALAAPFSLGTAQRLLAHKQVFLKNGLVIERMAQVDTIVLDKTGTLTTARGNAVSFHSLGPPLNATEESRVYSLTRHSTHPHSVRICESLRQNHVLEPMDSFRETAGGGIEGTFSRTEVRLGSRSWLQTCQVDVPDIPLPAGSVVYLAVGREIRGAFVLANALRPEADQLLSRLNHNFDLALLSGDNERERDRFQQLFGRNVGLHFNQTPVEKLHFVRNLQNMGKTLMMVGDGLNDAGALKQSDVGVAVVEKVGAFSPASDIILEAGQVARLADIIEFARRTSLVIRAGFGISAVYNLVGISIAAAGILSPLICAILMPLSSISVVMFACGMTRWVAPKDRSNKPKSERLAR